jgi:hypothetical protein
MAIQAVFPQDADKVIAPFALTWMEEGEQKGRQEEAVAFALRLLRKRFGEVTEETEAQIKSLSLEALEEFRRSPAGLRIAGRSVPLVARAARKWKRRIS